MPVNYHTGGRIEKGKLRLDDERAFKTAMWTMKEGPVVIRIEQPRSKRSLDQNAYWHAAVFPPIADHLGYTIPECKLVLMGECWGWKKDEMSGHEIPIKPSTSDMSVEEGPWAKTELGVSVPLPNEWMEAAS
jgi:hypothetical protein